MGDRYVADLPVERIRSVEIPADAEPSARLWAFDDIADGLAVHVIAGRHALAVRIPARRLLEFAAAYDRAEYHRAIAECDRRRATE